MTKVLEIEPLIDETLDLFMSKLETNFLSELGKRKTVCMMDDWLGYCMRKALNIIAAHFADPV